MRGVKNYRFISDTRISNISSTEVVQRHCLELGISMYTTHSVGGNFIININYTHYKGDLK